VPYIRATMDPYRIVHVCKN